MEPSIGIGVVKANYGVRGSEKILLTMIMRCLSFWWHERCELECNKIFQPRQLWIYAVTLTDICAVLGSGWRVDIGEGAAVWQYTIVSLRHLRYPSITRHRRIHEWSGRIRILCVGERIYSIIYIEVIISKNISMSSQKHERCSREVRHSTYARTLAKTSRSTQNFEVGDLRSLHNSCHIHQIYLIVLFQLLTSSW